MRRKDRERDEAFAWNVFDKAEYAVLATVNSDGSPYCIPLSTARIVNGTDTVIYFHCAYEGQKIDNIRRNPAVTLTCAANVRVPEGRFTTEFESCVITGRAEIVEEESEKTEGLRAICEKYTPAMMDRFEKVLQSSLSSTCIFRIIPLEVTGKELKTGTPGEQGGTSGDRD
ncbi:MAG: pyridoxamine 5'-phosphate oxidase family protein [Spirochaetaceae bacterium]|jgi:nitroimidazol reductase NimA-like FMN-containing flavoprotein (pyridoxamine 5'-phosphate oxidase superfamily)|nr:pyridoxamine 5'-phosphate oxidase family protein [Spirochaetaceae bacterium]